MDLGAGNVAELHFVPKTLEGFGGVDTATIAEGVAGPANLVAGGQPFAAAVFLAIAAAAATSKAVAAAVVAVYLVGGNPTAVEAQGQGEVVQEVGGLAKWEVAEVHTVSVDLQAGKQLVPELAFDLTYQEREEVAWSGLQSLLRLPLRPSSCPPRCTGTPRCTAASCQRPCSGGVGGSQLRKLNLLRPSG